MIFNGAEYHSQLLTNKEFGLNTTPELLAKQRELKDHSLGLFNHHPLDWRALPRHDRHGRPVIGIRSYWQVLLASAAGYLSPI